MSLMPFQGNAIAWLSSRPTAFLALEQGLGKTVVASCDLVPPAVVVCPASLKFNWAAELAIWRPELTTHVVRSAKDPLKPADVIIVNYESMFWVTFDKKKEIGKDGKPVKRKRTIHKLQLPDFNTLIVDESHYVKSYDSVRTAVVCGLIQDVNRVRLLSGTPVVNRPIELWPLLYATDTTKLGWMEFGRRYCKGWKTPWGNWDFSGASRLDELHEILAPVMLRLTKAQVLPELPEKTFKVIELDLPVDKREKALDVDAILRNPDPVAFEALPDILHMNAQRKLPLAIQHIRDALESTAKVVVFAHHRDIAEALLSGLADYNPVRVVGGDSAEARFEAVKRFQNDPSCRVFVGNIKAAGTGLTLTASDRVIFVECSWTPADLQQCADRCHRIGQKNPVLVEILTIHQSVDATILHAVLGKMEIINQIVKETSMTALNNAAIAAKLRELASLFDAAPAAEAEASAPAPAPAPAAETKTTKVTRAPKPEQTVTSAGTATVKNVTEDSIEQDAVDAPTDSSNTSATIEQVREGVAKLIDAGKRSKALEILKNHGAAKVGELAEDKFASVVKAIEKELA